MSKRGRKMSPEERAAKPFSHLTHYCVKMPVRTDAGAVYRKPKRVAALSKRYAGKTFDELIELIAAHEDKVRLGIRKRVFPTIDHLNERVKRLKDAIETCDKNLINVAKLLVYGSKRTDLR